MNLTQQLSNVTQNIIDAICGIKELPEDLLPHTVFVEEISEQGDPVYRKYQLIDLDRVDKNCIVYDPSTDYQDEIELYNVNVDWLLTLWTRYLELSGQKEPEPKVMSVFLFPQSRFERYAADTEIIKDFESEEDNESPVEKYTVEEYTAMVNDNENINSGMYVRFMMH